jgi:hypothetical protein
MSMKNFNDTIDLPACSAVPQTTAPPREYFEIYRDFSRSISIIRLGS